MGNKWFISFRLLFRSNLVHMTIFRLVGNTAHAIFELVVFGDHRVQKASTNVNHN